MPDPLLALTVALLITAVALLLFYPRSGLIPRWQRTRRMNERVLIEDALKHVHRCETHSLPPTLQSVAGALNITTNQAVVILRRMQAHDLLRVKGDEFRLTPTGRDYALRIIRAHRLWERYLAEETGFEESQWHDMAELYEHRLSPDQADALSSQLGNPTHDPHGDPIPTSGGEMKPHGGEPLTNASLDVPVRIVHLEDEPEAVYAQLVAEGLHPGMEVRLIEATSQRLRFWAGGDEHVLAPIVATNISVMPIPTTQEVPQTIGERLSTLKPGQMGRVVAISPGVRGAERRRLMDLGITPGTVIAAEYRSPSGDPTAYRIRGALIALRQEQSNFINITPFTEAAS
jgi:DtxR family Mn-dependent transcriptional regulator